jgi:hypothetical protein
MIDYKTGAKNIQGKPGASYAGIRMKMLNTKLRNDGSSWKVHKNQSHELPMAKARTK